MIKKILCGLFGHKYVVYFKSITLGAVCPMTSYYAISKCKNCGHQK